MQLTATTCASVARTLACESYSTADSRAEFCSDLRSGWKLGAESRFEAGHDWSSDLAAVIKSGSAADAPGVGHRTSLEFADASSSRAGSPTTLPSAKVMSALRLLPNAGWSSSHEVTSFDSALACGTTVSPTSSASLVGTTLALDVAI